MIYRLRSFEVERQNFPRAAVSGISCRRFDSCWREWLKTHNTNRTGVRLLRPSKAKAPRRGLKCRGQIKNRGRHRSRCQARRRARRHLSRVFAPGDSREALKPQRSGLWFPKKHARILDVGAPLTPEETWRGLPIRFRSRFVRGLRHTLLDLGVGLVGRIPVDILVMLWENVGDRLMARHSVRCCCAVCVTHRAGSLSLSRQVADLLLGALRSLSVRAVLAWLVPSPVRAAAFVVTRVWRWLKAGFGLSYGAELTVSLWVARFGEHLEKFSPLLRFWFGPWEALTQSVKEMFTPFSEFWDRVCHWLDSCG